MVTFDTTPWNGGRVEAWTQPSPWGELMTLATTDRGLAFLEFGLRKDAVERRFGTQHVVWVERTIDLEQMAAVHVWGTPFQEAVWRVLMTIPRGETRSYAWVAEQIGTPKAVRAVGSAVGSNPVSIVVPCHRVVRSDGGWGGYAWGLPLKQKIVQSERL